MDNIIQNNVGNLPTEALSQAAQQSQRQLLRNAVEESLRKYISKFNDSDSPSDIYDMVLTEIEMPLLKTIMQFSKGNQSKAALCLGISRGTLRKKLKFHGFLT